MAEEPDGVDEVFEGMLRVGLTAAGQVAEVIARAREQAARQARAASEQQAHELAGRLHAERSAARAQLAPVQRDEWWDHARPAAVVRAWETARAWERLDPEAGRAVERIRREVRDRFGIDVDAPGGNPAAVYRALEERGATDPRNDAQRRVAGRDQTEAARLLAGADRVDRAGDSARGDDRTRDAGQSGYDTAARRTELAAALSGVVDVETAQARVLADTTQAHPPGAALTSPQRVEAPVAVPADAARQWVPEL